MRGGKMEGKRMNGEGCVRKCEEEGWAPQVEFSIIHLHRMATSGTLFAHVNEGYIYVAQWIFFKSCNQTMMLRIYEQILGM
jgi:hypothetical protein